LIEPMQWTTLRQALNYAAAEGKLLLDGKWLWEPDQLRACLEHSGGKSGFGPSLDAKAYVGPDGIHLLDNAMQVIQPPRWLFERGGQRA